MLRAARTLILPQAPRFARLRGLSLRSSLGYRVVGKILLITAVLALASTTAQMLVLVAQDRAAVLKRFETIEPALMTALRIALRSDDAAQIEALLADALKIDGVDLIRLTDQTGNVLLHSEGTQAGLLMQEYTLGPGGETRLHIGLGFGGAADTLRAQATTTLLAELTQVLVIAMSILWVFERLAARRLRRLADQVQHGSWRLPGAQLTLDRCGSVLPDEIDRIIYALEAMWADAREAFDTLEREKRRADTLYHTLRTTQMEQGQLSTALSHDLITPVNTLQILLDELQAEMALQAPNADRDELLEDMRVTANRMRHQVQSVMHYSTLLTHPARPVPTRLDEVLRSCHAHLTTRFALENGQITWGPLGWVMGDRDELGLLFTEVLTNAVIYAHPERKPQIHIARVSADAGDSICIEISDNGRGIAPQHQSAVFDLFARLHTYAEIPGAGLGLALCRRIMTRHEGTISLRSTPGAGTHVRLRFPQGDPHA